MNLHVVHYRGNETQNKQKEKNNKDKDENY